MPPMNNSSETVVPHWSSSLLQLKDELLAIGLESKEGIRKQWVEDVDLGSNGSFFTADDLSVHSIHPHPKSVVVSKDENKFSIITKKRSIKSTTNSSDAAAKPLGMPSFTKSSKRMKEKKQKQKSTVSSLSNMTATLLPRKKVKEMVEKRAAKKEVSYYE